MAWHGAGLLLLSGRSFLQGDVARGAELWSKALLEMDEAGKREPDNPADAGFRAPPRWFAAFPQRASGYGPAAARKALADYEHVAGMQKTYFDSLNIHMRSELLFGMADGWARNGDAVEKARAGIL